MKFEIRNRKTGEVQLSTWIEGNLPWELEKDRWRELGYVLSNSGNLFGSDLTGVIPVIENIHQKVYSAASAPGALNMGDWHTCDTTHCRAAWVTTLAGEAGGTLEYYLGISAAAILIYIASDPDLDHIPSFYCSNELALADMKAMAEAEAAKQRAAEAKQ